MFFGRKSIGQIYFLLINVFTFTGHRKREKQLKQNVLEFNCWFIPLCLLCVTLRNLFRSLTITYLSTPCQPPNSHYSSPILYHFRLQFFLISNTLQLMVGDISFYIRKLSSLHWKLNFSIRRWMRIFLLNEFCYVCHECMSILSSVNDLFLE